jgi:hypothetical protein
MQDLTEKRAPWVVVNALLQMRDVIAVHVGHARAMQWAETDIQLCMTIRRPQKV